MPHSSLPPTAPPGRPGSGAWRVHAAGLIAGFTALFCWIYAQPLFSGEFLAESDLYEYYLPIFLSPITMWSSFEFGGLPAFADPGDFVWYPPHFLFARVLGSWNGLAISAYVLAGVLTTAYVLRISGSWRGALFAGVSYSLSEAMMERLPHLGTLHAFAWLPLIVLAIDRLATCAPAARWIALGGIGAACCFLAGHPQLAVYSYYVCGAYALTAGIAERAPRSYYVHVVLMLVAGILLAGIKAIPLAEASFHMARQVVSFDQFTSRTLGATDLLSALLPHIQHDGREAPMYVGLATLLLAIVGAHLARRNWRIAFWLSAAVAVVLISLGSVTPVARLAYELPLLDKFRVAPRFLFVFAFGCATVAGLAVAALERRELTQRHVARAAVALAALLVTGTIAVIYWHGSMAFEPRPALPLISTFAGASGLGWQAIFGLAAVVVLAWLARTRTAPSAALAALLLVTASDLLFSLPYGVTAAGITPITIPPEQITPSVHAQRLGAALQPQHQRLLAIGGTHRDAIVPAAFARLWQIPIAGGYGPMLLARHNATASMGTNGSVSPEVLAFEDAALDLLAVRYIAVRQDDYPTSGTFTRDGLAWSTPRLELAAGRSDCSQPYVRHLSLALPTDIRLSGFAFVGYLRCSEGVSRGAEAARIDVLAGNRTVSTRSLLAGAEIADRDAANGGAGAATAFADPDLPTAFLVRHTLDGPVAADRLDITGAATGGWPVVERLTLVDADGRAWPQQMPQMFLRDTRRWREVSRLRTSRATDRGTDQDVPGEQEYVVYENLRALPRAWIVPTVIALPEADMAPVIHASQLPDGRPFDPATMALVDEGVAAVGQAQTGKANATVRTIEDGRIAVDVESEGGGFLVLSEAYYPGWRASLDGRDVPMMRADMSLQGLPVPPGAHTVVFTLVPQSLRLGAAATVLTGVILLAAVLRTRAKGGLLR